MGFKEQEAMAEDLAQREKTSGFALDAQGVVYYFRLVGNDAGRSQRRHTEETETEAEKIERLWEQNQRHFHEHLGRMAMHGQKMSELIESNPTTTFRIHPEMAETVRSALETLQKLQKAFPEERSWFEDLWTELYADYVAKNPPAKKHEATER